MLRVMNNNLPVNLKTALRCFKTSAYLVVFTVMFSIGNSTKLNGQDLSIEINTIPDTVLLGSFFEADLTVHNLSAESQLGNLQIWFLNQSKDSITAPLGGFNVNQYFAAEQARNFNVAIPATEDFFRLGGNTVVIWPSFVGQPIQGDSILKEIYVLDPNSVPKSGMNQLYFFPNPAGSVLSVKASKNAAIPKMIIIRDLSGRVLLNAPYLENEGSMNIEKLSAGIYILELELPEGKNFVQRIVKSTSEY
jgi:hypothetical protein